MINFIKFFGIVFNYFLKFIKNILIFKHFFQTNNFSKPSYICYLFKMFYVFTKNIWNFLKFSFKSLNFFVNCFKFYLIFLISIKFYFWKILENFLIFQQILYKCFQTFSKVLDEFIFTECSPEPKFLRRHYITGLERNSCMKFCTMFLPRTRIIESLRYNCNVHYSCTSAVQYLNERKWECSFM